MKASCYGFTEEDMAVDEILGFPTAYAKLCKDRSLSLYSHGPPLTFNPYSLTPQQAKRAKELDEMFPIIDPQARSTTKPNIFVSLLWKQLNHLGNAGFDPAVFRVDPYGNVLYYHADSASPLAWDIDHWFPCSRGGLTVPRNLRILQWQVCRRKHNHLEMLVPWWDLQLGISINQFLSIFAAPNPDFRRRAFSLLFANGKSEELNDSQTVDAHSFPRHFDESKELLGLAPAAIVFARNESRGDATLKSIDIINRHARPSTPIVAATKSKYGVLKENRNPDTIDMQRNPYQAIAMARDALKQREETAKVKGEIQKLDEKMTELKQKNEEDNVTIQDLERVLTKRRRKAEKCRQLAEAQSSYRITLEKMIRDAMHQSAVYKQQSRLNQAATSALMATLEAQRALCDSAEKELHKKYRQRDDLEKRIRPHLEQGRKRSKVVGSVDFSEELDCTTPPSSSNLKLRTPPHKELREFLEEEAVEAQRKQAAIAALEAKNNGSIPAMRYRTQPGNDSSTTAMRYRNQTEDEDPITAIRYGYRNDNELHDGATKEMEDKIHVPVFESEEVEDEESQKKRGKGNVDKWLQMLLDNTLESDMPYSKEAKDPETSNKQNEKYALKGKAVLQYPDTEHRENKAHRFHEGDYIRMKEDVVKIEPKARPSSTHSRPTLETDHSSDAGSTRNRGKEAKLDIEAKARSLSTPRRVMTKTSHMKEGSSIRNTERVPKTTDIKAKSPPTSGTHRWTMPETSYMFDADSIRNAEKEAKMETESKARCSSAQRRDIPDKLYVSEAGSSIGNTGKQSSTEKPNDIGRSESTRSLRRFPSSPSMILGMRKGVDCMRKKPKVTEDDSGNDGKDQASGNKYPNRPMSPSRQFIKASIKSIKKVVKI